MAFRAFYGVTALGITSLQIKCMHVLSKEEVKNLQEVIDNYIMLRNSVSENIKAICIFHEVNVGTLTEPEIELQLLPLLKREKTNLEYLKQD